MSTAAALAFAARYVARHRAQSALLACAIGLVMALPVSVRVFADTVARVMRSRAAATPQVMGAPGSALDLMLAALHFRRQGVQPVKLGACAVAIEEGLGTMIPLHVRHHSQGASIVGTDLEYFAFRGLRVAGGRMFTRLGDCVLGARVAAERGLQPGASLFTTPDHVFDIAGEYPLKMRITGVLAESGTPDDHAAFCDVKTAWLIEGRAHGHDDLVTADGSVVLKRESGNVVGNASVRMYQEVTDANLNSFHFHGDAADFPISAAIVLPVDARAEAILAGRHARGAGGLQLLRPSDELGGLLDTIFRIEGAAISALLLVGLAAAMVAAVVFALSFKLRRREFATLEDIGVRAGTLRLVKLFEMGLVLLAASVIAAALVAAVTALAPSLIHWGLR